MTSVYLGVTPGMPDDLERPERQQLAEPETEQQRYGDEARDGPLLTLAPEAAARLALRMWRSQDPKYVRCNVEGIVNERRRNGEVNIRAVTKVQDQSLWQVWEPPRSAPSAPVNVLNKADRLCQRFASQVYADEPKLEATPDNGSSEARDAAELATRLLKDVDGEGVLNDLDAHRAAFDYASSWGSGYIRYYLDPKGGGRQPVTIEAAQEAARVEDATMMPVPDPMTGETTMVPRPGPFERRHVSPDGTLTDDPQQAALRWMPQLCREVYTAAHCRLWPPTATDVWDAEGILCATYAPLSQLEQEYPELRNLGEEEVQQLTQLRPPNTHALLPMKDGRAWDPRSDIIRDRLVFHLLAYFTECPQYPDGAYVCVVGDQKLVRRGSWILSGDRGRERKDLPFTQVRQFRGERGNPHGKGLMHIFGPAAEWRAELVGAVEDVLDKIRTRKTFVPTNSIIQPKQMLLPGLTMVPINPGGEPRYEEVPTDALKPASELFQIATREMDDASGLQQTGQALETSDAISGKAKSLVLSQVQAGLSDVRQHVANALVRAARIKLQLLREVPVPQLVKYVGEDGEYKVRAWRGADLRSTRDVRLVPGSLTMMSPAQKAQNAVQYATSFPGLLAPDDLRDALFGEIAPQMGWQDNPHVMRARQQVARWEQGPAPQAPPQEPVPAFGMQPVMQQTMQLVPGPDGQPTPQPTQTPAIDPMTGQPQMQPAGPMVDPAALAIFDVRPVDHQPDVAAIRAREFGRAMAGYRYGQFPPEWRAALDVAYQQAVQAANPAPPPMPANEAGAAPSPGRETPISPLAANQPPAQRAA